MSELPIGINAIVKEILPSINDVERRIIGSEYFSMALHIGKKRDGHPEAQLGSHIGSILSFIDRHYNNSPAKEDLRILALVHDIGKLGRVDEIDKSIPDDISPDLAAELRKQMIKFSEEFPVLPDEESDYIPSHALFSEKFARKMDVEPRLLTYVRYHDSGFKFFKEADNNNGEYNAIEFMHGLIDEKVIPERVGS